MHFQVCLNLHGLRITRACLDNLPAIIVTDPVLSRMVVLVFSMSVNGAFASPILPPNKARTNRWQYNVFIRHWVNLRCNKTPHLCCTGCALTSDFLRNLLSQYPAGLKPFRHSLLYRTSLLVRGLVCASTLVCKAGPSFILPNVSLLLFLSSNPCLLVISRSVFSVGLKTCCHGDRVNRQLQSDTFFWRSLGNVLQTSLRLITHFFGALETLPSRLLIAAEDIFLGVQVVVSLDLVRIGWFFVPKIAAWSD